MTKRKEPTYLLEGQSEDELEVWKNINNFPYQISNKGRIRRSISKNGTQLGKILKSQRNRVRLTNGSKSRCVTIKHLLIEIFGDNQENIDEIWKKIPNFSNYSASNLGRIRRDVGGPGAFAGIILNPNSSKKKRYSSITLYQDGKQQAIPVHIVILLTFVGPPPTPEYQGAHDNGDSRDNSLSNLFWKTCSENSLDKLRHGTIARGRRHGMAKLKEEDIPFIRKMRQDGSTLDVIAKAYNVSIPVISGICKREAWRHVL